MALIKYEALSPNIPKTVNILFESSKIKTIIV